MASWNLRDTFKKAIDQWYWLLGLILIGGLAGYLSSHFFPAPYRATAELYVGIDVTRVNEMEYLIPFAKEEPLNLDDYKNWQLKQLADIFYSDPVLEGTATNLTAQDPTWSGISLAELRDQMDIYWYDTGIWRLEFTSPVREQAVEGVQTWLDTGYDYIADLMGFSQETARLDADLEINKKAASVLKSQSARLASFQKSASEWMDVFNSYDQSAPLTAQKREELGNWTLNFLSHPELWQVPMDGYPAQGAPVSSYAVWLEKAIANSQAASEETDQQLALLTQEREDLLPAYHQSLEDSLGLSANVVLRENSSSIDVAQVRNPGKISLAGAALGLLVWLILLVVQARGSQDE